MRIMQPTTVLRGASLLALIILAAAGRASAAEPAFNFDGTAWQFREGVASTFGFEPAPPVDADRREDRLGIVVMDVSTKGFGAPQLAATLLQDMRQNGTVLKAWTLPADASRVTDYLIVGRTCNAVSRGIEMNFLRITTTAEGSPMVVAFVHHLAADTPDQAVERWLARDGAHIEHALATWRDFPSLDALGEMRREKPTGP